MYQSKLEKGYFISYSRTDLAIARQLKEDLKKHGFEIWMGEDNELEGTKGHNSIKKNIQRSIAILYLVSPASRHPLDVDPYLRYAKICVKNIIPLWIQGDTTWGKVVALDLFSTDYVDLRGKNYKNGIDELTRILNTLSNSDPRFTRYIHYVESKETNTFNFHRQLRVFLCHASEDKPRVRDLYKRLVAVGIEAWLDKESLIGGQTWALEISKAIRNVHVVIVYLSRRSINKRGFVQKEIKLALDEADKLPEGTIFIIPVKEEEFDLPDRLNPYQAVDFFEEDGFEQLMRALRQRADELGFMN